MPSFNEILLVAVILVGILFVPRLMNRRIDQGPQKPPLTLSRNMRLAIVVSILFPAVAAAVIQPWHGDLVVFLYAGLGPVALGWLIYWVLTGRRK